MKITTPDGFKLDTEYIKPKKATKVIIFAHGMTVDKNDEGVFVRAAKILNQKGLATIRFDFRAHGKSDGDSIKDFTISNELIDLKTIISFAQKEFQWLGLAGASFGGSIAALFTGRNPKIIQKLLLVNPILDYLDTLNLNTPWAKKYFSNLDARLKKDGFIRLSSRHFKTGPVMFKEMKQYFPSRDLRNYQNPLITIHSKQDSCISFDNVYHHFNQLNNQQKEFKIIEGAEHGFDDEPFQTQVTQLIVEFFTK